MERSLGLCDPEPARFVVYVPHGNHPIWTMPNCSADATSCIGIYTRKIIDMGTRVTTNYGSTGKSTDTPQNWINMTIVMMSVSLLAMMVLIGGAYFSRVNRELKAHQKEEEPETNVAVEDWYLNVAARSLSLLTATQLHEKEEMAKKE